MVRVGSGKVSNSFFRAGHFRASVSSRSTRPPSHLVTETGPPVAGDPSRCAFSTTLALMLVHTHASRGSLDRDPASIKPTGRSARSPRLTCECCRRRGSPIGTSRKIETTEDPVYRGRLHEPTGTTRILRLENQRRYKSERTGCGLSIIAGDISVSLGGQASIGGSGNAAGHRSCTPATSPLARRPPNG